MRHYPKKNMVTSCIIADPRLPVLDVFTQTAAITPMTGFSFVAMAFGRILIEKRSRNFCG